MTRISGLVLAVSLLAPSIASAEDLTLRDVIELHRSGLGEDLLIAVIDADGGPFALGFADIQDLKSDGISERVIAALVRTGSRRAVTAGEGAAPVVHVQQDVINYVVPAVVLVDAPGSDSRRHHRGDDIQSGHRSSRGDRERAKRPASPPASWVTRSEDGVNIDAAGEARKGVPPAAWVTPRDPKRDEKPQPPR